MKQPLLAFLFTTSAFFGFSQSAPIGTNPAGNTNTPTSPELVQFGIKAGLNVSTIKFDALPNSDYLQSFHVGGLAHIHLSDRFALQPEVTYSRQGAEVNEWGIRKWIIDYVNIPVLGQYMYNGFRLETGPQIGFLTNAKYIKMDDVETNSLKNNLNATDISWDFGASYLSSSGLGASARYNLGLSNINDEHPLSRDGEIKNRVWQFSLFYQFNQ